MKLKLLIVGIVFVAGLTQSNAIAQNSSDNNPKKVELIKNIKRPHKDDNESLEINVECTYTKGLIHVEFLIPEGTSRISVTDLTRSGRITEPIINGRHTTPIGCKAGTYQIEIETEIGIYTGYLILE